MDCRSGGALLRFSKAPNTLTKTGINAHSLLLSFRNFPQTAKVLFMESLQREDIPKGSYLCRQNDDGDKLFVLEEGSVNFIVNDKVAGTARDGSVFGELSLIYGVKRQCDVMATTDCIVWNMDTLAFRRIQAVVARDNLKTSKSKIMTKFGKEASTLSEEQVSCFDDDDDAPHTWHLRVFFWELLVLTRPEPPPPTHTHNRRKNPLRRKPSPR